MQTLRQFCLALTFTLALGLPVFAGEISTGIAPPPALGGEMQTTVSGQIETPSSEATATGSAAEIALSLLQSVLSLF